ncbi:cytochrome c-type biogenesis protein [Aggregatilinea lenta]|uniref:cytochrome c-type biogenesis protein n=1 Tax=Aggregatilinea lenta TaxID=913108 RepID=UPI000E5B1BA5|nr:cytochrome c-type biogenesis protein CcmH [Aggregatilinea lenta]
MNRLSHRLFQGSLAALAIVLVLGAALLPSAQPVRAQGGETLPEGVTWDQVNAIAHKMYCDVCEGIPLDECESVACRNWRQEIGRLISLGRSEDEILDYFVERYGADVASLPRSEGDRWLAYAVPFVIAFVLAGLGLFQMMRLRQRGRQPGQVVRRSSTRLTTRPVPDDLDPLTLDRIQRDLEGLER